MTKTYTHPEAIETLRLEGIAPADADIYLDQIIDAGPEITDQPDDHWIFTAGDLDVIRAQAKADRDAAEEEA